MEAIKIGDKFTTRHKKEVGDQDYFIVTAITDKRVSYKTSDGYSYNPNKNTIRIFWASIKQATEYLESGWWVIISK